MAQIGMKPEDVEARASEFAVEASNVEAVISKMDTLLTRLQEEWAGDASRSFAERYTELRPGFVKSKQLIDEISAYLRKTANDMVNWDKEHMV